MIIRDLFALVSNQKRKQERIILIRKFAVGISIVAAISAVAGILCATKRGKKMRKDLGKNVINTLEIMKDTIGQETVAVKDSVAKAEHDVDTVIKDVCDKTEDAKKDIQVGRHEAAKDIHKAAINISKDFK